MRQKYEYYLYAKGFIISKRRDDHHNRKIDKGYD